ncbi:unnamed protein product [Rotaria sp. Silwood2]|nr:unnamed protein product [Rotaria sp. Silwood2]CAF4413423.1 unnamed protein product [Rotaria sp. Silwood2]
MKVFIKSPSDHSHVPDPNRFHSIRLKNELKIRRASSGDAASTILFDALRTIPLTSIHGKRKKLIWPFRSIPIHFGPFQSIPIQS